MKTIGGVYSGTTKKGRRHDQKRAKDEPFTVPKNIPLQLEGAEIRPIDVLPLHFYTEFQWLIDFAFAGIFVYAITEIYYAVVQPKNEFNLSIMWCLLVVGFTVKVLFSLTSMYFRTDEGGERMLCVIFGFFFLVFAMGILIVDENTLEFGLEKAYVNFSKEAREFLAAQGIDSAGPATLLTFRIVLAFLCAFIGAFMTFPGLRLAKMHTNSMKYASEHPLKQLCLNINMIAPLLIILLWVKPVTREYLVDRSYNGRQIVNGETFETIRLVVILAFCLFRFLLCWTHLQSHLNLACEKVEALRHEAGRISSVDLQRMVARVYYYLCVVALQYLAPIIFLMYCCFILKTLGNFSFNTAFNLHLPTLRNVTSMEKSNENLTKTSPSHSTDTHDNIKETVTHYSLALASLKQVFTPMYFRGLFSFLCWWICTTWFCTSAFGMIYYSYFISV